MILAAILSALLSLPAHAATSFFFNAATGNINDGGSFGKSSPGVAGTDFPTNGDSFTIKQGSTATVPTGYGVALASISFQGGATRNTPTVLYLMAGSSVGVTANIQTAANCLPNCAGSSLFSNIYMNAGSTLALNNSNIIDIQTGSGITGLYFNGASNNHALVTGSTGSFKAGAQGSFNRRDINWSYVDFQGLGNMDSFYCATNADFKVSSITWVSSGQFKIPAALAGCANRYTEYSDFRAGTQLNGNGSHIIVDAASTLHPTGRNDFVWNTASSDTITRANMMQFEVDATSVNVHGNIFNNYTVALAGSNGLDIFITTNTFLGTNVVNPNCNVGVGNIHGNSVFSGNFIYSECSNEHAMVLTSPTTTQVIGNVGFQNAVNGTGGQDGKLYLCNNATPSFQTGRVSGNLLVGISQSFDVFDCAAVGPLTETTQFDHNTVVYNTNAAGGGKQASNVNALLTVGENYAGVSNYISGPVFDNLLYFSTPTASQSVKGQIGQDLQPGSGGGQKISSMSCTGYNSNIGSPLYTMLGNYPSVGADVQANPNFVNANATPFTWDTSLGGPGTSASFMAEMLKMNGYGGTFNSAYNTQAAITYFQAAFAPQNTSLGSSACDGSYFGAVNIYTAPAASSTQKGMDFRWGTFRHLQ